MKLKEIYGHWTGVVNFSFEKEDALSKGFDSLLLESEWGYLMRFSYKEDKNIVGRKYLFNESKQKVRSEYLFEDKWIGFDHRRTIKYNFLFINIIYFVCFGR